MATLACPHCNDVIEIFGEPLAHECECGAIMEVFEGDPVDHDRAAEASAPPISLVGFALMFAGAFLIACLACAGA
jgi:hypothetical protein